MERVERVRVKSLPNTVHLLGACQGLEGEAKLTKQAILEIEPRIVALSLDPFLLDHVHEFEEGSMFSVEDKAYRSGLEEWGDVTLPPPEYAAALEAAETIGARVEGVDLPEGAYMDRYTDIVSVFDLTRRALRVRWLRTRPPNTDTPVSFCQAFDVRVNQGPYRELEMDREREIADRLKALAQDGTVACTLEVQRLEGVQERLKAPSARAPPHEAPT